MAALALCLVVFLAMTGYSSAAYCVCYPGLSDYVLQKNIDYACGSGANCGPILQTGTCYNPNTVKDHCNCAVNSYYQSQGEAPGSCNFTGTAQVSQTSPSGAASQCYPSSPRMSNWSSNGDIRVRPRQCRCSNKWVSIQITQIDENKNKNRLYFKCKTCGFHDWAEIDDAAESHEVQLDVSGVQTSCTRQTDSIEHIRGNSRP